MPKLKFRYLFIIVIVIVLLILIPISFRFFQTKQESPLNSLNEQAILLTKDQPHIQERISSRFEILKDPEAENNEKYESVKVLVFFFGALYSEKNNPKFKEYVAKLDNYSKLKLADQYKAEDFTLACQDPSCTDSNPDEVKKLMALIENSDFPDDIKIAYMTNIRNTNYLENKHKQNKAEYYYSIYVDLRTNTLIASSSSLPAILTEFSGLIQTNYSNETKGFEEEYKKNNPALK